jgi:hypothetical protein
MAYNILFGKVNKYSYLLTNSSVIMVGQGGAIAPSDNFLRDKHHCYLQFMFI